MTKQDENVSKSNGISESRPIQKVNNAKECNSETPVVISSHPAPYHTSPHHHHRRGSLQLWQFLVSLLDDPTNGQCICWTGRGMEFKLLEPEEVKKRIQNYIFF